MHTSRLCTFATVIFILTITLSYTHAHAHADSRPHLHNNALLSRVTEQWASSRPLSPSESALNRVSSEMLQGRYASSSAKLRAAAPSSMADRISQLDQFISDFMSCRNITSLAVSIVANGTVLKSQGYGYSDASRTETVDGDTRYGIGSISKSFTSTLIGILLDEGLIGSLDDPVRKYLPDFELLDRDANAIVTLKDLMGHRTGLPRHDYAVFFKNWTSPSELVAAVRYLRPTFPIRQQWQYNNWMIEVVGAIVERVGIATGRWATWSEAVQTLIFDKLGMDGSFPTYTQAKDAKRMAQPTTYSEATGYVNQPYDLNLQVDVTPAAGSVVSTANDMAKYMLLHLKQTSKGIISDKTLDLLHSPFMVVPNAISTTYHIPDFIVSNLGGDSYGANWFQSTWRGYKRVYHGGDTFGYHALTSLLPEAGIGITVMTNTDNPGDLWRDALSMQMMDWLLGHEPLFHNATEACWFPCDMFNLPGCPGVPAHVNSEASDRLEAKQPTTVQSLRDYSEYAGVYTHPAYPPVQISVLNDSHYPLMLTYGTSAYIPHLSTELTSLTALGYSADQFGLVNPNVSHSLLSFRRTHTGKMMGFELDFNYGDGVYPLQFTNQLFDASVEYSGCAPSAYDASAVWMTDDRLASSSPPSRTLSSGGIIGLIIGSTVLSGVVMFILAFHLLRKTLQQY